jgi:hypothetical protein
MTSQGKIAILCAAALTSTAAFACTSWVLHPSVTKSHRMIVQKCRDSASKVLDADMRTSESGIRWMRIGAGGGAAFSMNACGVVATSNNGDPLTKPEHPRPKIGGWVLGRVGANSSTAREGLKFIEELQRNPAGIFFVADPKQAFLMESGADYAECQEITGGICVVANEMHLPGIDGRARSKLERIIRQRAREANTRAALREAAKRDGGYTREGCFATSRLPMGEGVKKQFPFRVQSQTAVCFELDGEFPDTLSTAYIALGPQRYTVYIPSPMALEQFPEKIRNGEWAAMALKFRKTAGEKTKLVDRIPELEKQLLAEYDKVREEARTLLKSGKRDAAVKLLNDCYARQYARAEELLTTLLAEAEAAQARKTAAAK